MVDSSVPSSQDEIRERARRTFELIELGVNLMRQNLRRRFPDESESAIEDRLTAWLHTRPGAEDGDAWGTPSKPDPDAIHRRAGALP